MNKRSFENHSKMEKKKNAQDDNKIEHKTDLWITSGNPVTSQF